MRISYLLATRAEIVTVVAALAVIGARESYAVTLPANYTVTTTVDDPTLATCDLAGSGPCSLRAGASLPPIPIPASAASSSRTD